MARPNARYRIHAVAQATGLSTASLRAWERRYGIPSPARGDSGYRLYSEQDIAQVKRMVSLGEQGIAPSEASRIVLDEGRWIEAPSGDESAEAPEHNYALVVSRLLAAARAVDQDQLERELYSALGMGSAWLVYENILAPTLAAIGDGWAQGTLSIGQEHLASQVMGTALRNLVRLVGHRDADRVVALACVDGEQHDLPLYGVAVLAASLGWKPRIVGPRTPPSALAVAIESTQPRLVGLSLTVPLVPRDAEALFAEYGRVCADIPWVVGGAAASAYQGPIEAAGGRLARSGVSDMRALFVGA